MKILNLDVCCSVSEYNRISQQIKIVDITDVDKVNDYVVFTLYDCTIEQLAVLENELTDCSSLINIRLDTADLLLIETFVDDHDLYVDIDYDPDDWIVINNHYTDSNMTFDVVKALLSL